MKSLQHHAHRHHNSTFNLPILPGAKTTLNTFLGLEGPATATQPGPRSGRVKIRSRRAEDDKVDPRNDNVSVQAALFF